MTRLQLAQKVHRILRIDANLPGTAPTATTGQTGVLNEIVSFVDDAYRQIQSAHEWWGFRLTQGTFNLTSSTRAYTRATIQVSLTTFDQFLPAAGQGFRDIPIYLTATGVSDSSHCAYVPYQQWRSHLDFGTRSSGKPSFFTIRQDQTIEFDPTPNATYTCVLDYRRTLHTMTADAHEPLFADDYHDAIVWGAVKAYCETRDAPAMYDLATRNFRREMGRLRGRYLPEMTADLTLFYGRDP
jgi:hypothetical protein